MNRINVTYLLLIVIGVCGCERKELCFNHDHAANLEIVVDYHLDWHTHIDTALFFGWAVDYNKLNLKEPEGVRMITYPHDPEITSQTYNMDKSGGSLSLAGGKYDILCYNNDTEYLLFSGEKAMLQATTRTRTRVSYSRTHPEEPTVTPPDMLYSSYLKDLEVESRRKEQTTIQRQQIEMRLYPRVFTYYVIYEFDSGSEYVALARGALSGMARSAFLIDGHTENTQVTLLYDCDKHLCGVEAIVRSFGLPGMSIVDASTENRSSQSQPSRLSLQDNAPLFWDEMESTRSVQVEELYAHRLTLELQLINGKEKTFEFDVTNQVNEQPRGGVIRVKGVTVTSEEGQTTSGSGFDASVCDWGENKDVLIPIE